MHHCDLYHRSITSISEAAVSQIEKASLAADSATDLRWPSETNGRCNSMSKAWNIDLLSELMIQPQTLFSGGWLTLKIGYEEEPRNRLSYWDSQKYRN